MNKNIIMVFLVIVVGGGAFFGGMKYQQSKQPAFLRQFGGNGQRIGLGTGGNANRGGFRPVNGEILSNDGTSITVKLSDGSSKIVILSETTSINKADVASKTDLKVGEKVAVFGSDNSDGSVTAQNIQINPISRDISPPSN